MPDTARAPLPAVAPIGANGTRLWGLDAETRLRRIARARGLRVEPSAGRVLVDLGYAFDPLWLTHVAARPGRVVTLDGRAVIAHAPDADSRARIVDAMQTGTPCPPDPRLEPIAYETAAGITNDELRKRERPFLDRLTPATVPALERASYFGAYKGVTDLLTKYLWPEWALVLTRIAARLGITPNQVTAAGALLCIAATVAFWHGWFWTGIATGLVFMVLDTVDGKLARCTITSSGWGEVFDHGIDLVHPPFWWYAWCVGCAAYGVPLAPPTFAAVMVVIVAGYVVQRLIEGAFIKLFGMHIHVWQRFDSQFRLVTARRNPNMVILVAALIVGRPDLGIVAVAGWTAASLAVHAVRLAQAMRVRAAGGAIRSWLA